MQVYRLINLFPQPPLFSGCISKTSYNYVSEFDAQKQTQICHILEKYLKEQALENHRREPIYSFPNNIIAFKIF